MHASPEHSQEQELKLKRTLVGAFLENVPDVVYFKDRDSRFIAVSKSKAARHDCTDPAALVGKSDADFFSPVHAELTRKDEEAIMNSGKSLLNKVEKIVWANGHISWSRSSKLPLRDEQGRIIGTFGMSQDITASKQMEEALESAHRDLIETSRMAGMAEVATGVLHNVGNVLNSLNVSAAVVGTSLRHSKVESLAKVSSLIKENLGDIANYVQNDAKGKLIPEFLESLARHLVEERNKNLREIESLQQHVDHIKEIVTMQQAYATMAGVTEPLEPAALFEDSLRMNASALSRHAVRVERAFNPVPNVKAERGKVLQILINLIRNAKYALDEGKGEERILSLGLFPAGSGTVRFVVSDNGVGIAQENLSKIFNHGFTTRAHGHGFGLHSSSLAAKEMRGTLTVHSDGPGKGASFALELPAADPSPVQPDSKKA